MTSEEIIAREADRLRALWGDPFAAPDMPPRTLLRQWLQTPPAEREPWLTAQISSHPLGPDAYSLLVLEPLLPPAPPLPPLSEKTRALMDQAWAERDRTPRKAAPTPPAAPARGVLCRSTETLEYFDPDRPLMQERRTWQPPDIILTAGPWAEEGGPLWRAVVATPAALWPDGLREPDDLPVTTTSGDEWIAHLWLEYPVSEAQIAAALAALDGDSLVALEQAGTALPDGLPLEDPEAEATRDPIIQQERDRLMARASFLSATADARRARAEWEVEVTAWLPDGITARLIALAGDRNELALAGADEDTVLCLVFSAAQIGLPLEVPQDEFRATAGGRDKWEIHSTRAESLEGVNVWEMDLASRRVRGLGTVKGGIARITRKLCPGEGRGMLFFFI